MKKKGLEILPPSLQSEADAIKAQKDEKYRVDALMRLTRKLYMGLEPTIKNLDAIKDDVHNALGCWMFGGVEKEDSPIRGQIRNPYMEDIQWVYPFLDFLERLSNIKRGESKTLDRIVHNLFWKLYSIGSDHKQLRGSWWCQPYSYNICNRAPTTSHLAACFKGAQDDFEDIAEMDAHEDSYLSQEWRKLEGELRFRARIPQEWKKLEQLRRKADIPAPVPAEPHSESNTAATTAKTPDVVRAIKVVERKVDNVSRNVKKDGRITREIKKQLDGDLAATDHDNEGEFKPDFKGRDDEDLLKDAWEAVHSDDKKGSRQCICLNIYRKDHPEAKVKDKAFRSFYNAIMYQLGRETEHSQS